MRMNIRLGAMVVALALAACAGPATRYDSGLWHFKAGAYGEAAPSLLEAVPAMESANPADPRVVTGYLALGFMASQKKVEAGRAEAYYLKALEAVRKYHAGDATLSRNAATEAGNFYLGRDDNAKALPLLVEAAQISERDPRMSRLLHAIDLDNVAVAQSALKNHDVALRYSDRALAQLDSLPDSKSLRATRGIVLYNRAFAYEGQGLTEQAGPAYRQALELVAANGEAWRLRVVVDRYAGFLSAQHRASEAEAIRRQYR